MCSALVWSKKLLNAASCSHQELHLLWVAPEAMETRAKGYLEHPRWNGDLRATFFSKRKNPNSRGEVEADQQQAKEVWGAPPYFFLCWVPPESRVGKKRGSTMGPCTKGPPPFWTVSIFSSWAQFYANNTLKEAQNTGYWGWGREEQANNSLSGSGPVK